MSAFDAERIRLARHEAAHAVIAHVLGWRIKLVRIGVDVGGLVDLWPDCARRPEYRDPAIATLLMFLLADAAAFRNGEYDGPPLPATLPPGGMRVVADIIAVLLAGFASEADPAASYRRALAIEGSDARQIEYLIDRYPAVASIRDNVIRWMPSLLADELADAVDAISAALLHPTDTALASSLGGEDVDRILADLDNRQMARAARRLHAQLDGLVLLATVNDRAA